MGVLGLAKAPHRMVLEAKLGRSLCRHEVARHRCDVPRCVSPEHLEPGTMSDNALDKSARRRLRMPAWPFDMPRCELCRRPYFDAVEGWPSCEADYSEQITALARRIRRARSSDERNGCGLALARIIVANAGHDPAAYVERVEPLSELMHSGRARWNRRLLTEAREELLSNRGRRRPPRVREAIAVLEQSTASLPARDNGGSR